MIYDDVLASIPEEDIIPFKQMIIGYRKKYIPPAKDTVKEVFNAHPDLKELLLKKQEASLVIEQSREHAWQAFLIEEAKFNTAILSDLHKKLSTPREILMNIIDSHIINSDPADLKNGIMESCGGYAGKIYPYIYALSLSNTQSRRSRAGTTFEAIIYQIYNFLGYPFDSQEKAGRAIFEEEGLGKKVDSVLPGIQYFREKRDKTIIGTMKTSLRERWQEVAEEIERTKIPVIHLLTVDSNLPKTKAAEMRAHNIIVVALESVIKKKGLSELKNVISYENYLFEEIPNFLRYWKLG